MNIKLGSLTRFRLNKQLMCQLISADKVPGKPSQALRATQSYAKAKSRFPHQLKEALINDGLMKDTIELL
ncbi:MAG: hypothetical protein ACWA5R_08875 [bacterium]